MHALPLAADAYSEEPGVDVDVYSAGCSAGKGSLRVDPHVLDIYVKQPIVVEEEIDASLDCRSPRVGEADACTGQRAAIAVK